ncbi:MAG: glycosyltransferase family 2 protein [Kiritimatiellia bacterium]
MTSIGASENPNKGNRPLLSVLIPAYHPPEILRRCLESVAGQTCPLEHVVLVDDSSPYDLSELKKIFPAIRFERNPVNLGISANWNRCLEEAEGEFVTFLHSDDELSPRWHERWRPVLASSPDDVNLFFSATTTMDVKGAPLFVLEFGQHAWCEGFPRNMQILWRNMTYGVPFSGALVYRRSFLQKMGGFPDRQYPNNADVYLNLKSFFETKVHYQPENLFFNRYHSGQSVCQSDVQAAHVAAEIYKQLALEKSELDKTEIPWMREALSIYLMIAVYHAVHGDWRRWRDYRKIGLSCNPWGWLNPWTWWFTLRFTMKTIKRRIRIHNIKV